ncbi:HD domain-containing protein [Pseudalkalibacillus berkeleyi]|uniref:HD domain-containing protein n=1 Tax=Pseudalkalibacillus berkeleyi TaxID=1069813 RepID=A0ABS9GWW9_9BACL|nr:HD domain-containing protein [Pseudalkalibacillus berkeleyi]MCF6137297.1 HD domain-containing protein [Pseudalkalibacillus berkeleyi]
MWQNKNIEKFVSEKLDHEHSGHDWGHIDRVRKIAIHIAAIEGADRRICEIAALVHDLIDDKLFDDEEIALNEVIYFLKSEGISESDINHIVEIITTMSFSKSQEKSMRTLEGKVVQDADRLDALGAIGIARTFKYAGAKGDAMYNPAIKARTEQMTKDEYRNGESTAINHFYEKLFKLKGLMNTKEAVKIAEERHNFMEHFVDQFLTEWVGKDF